MPRPRRLLCSAALLIVTLAACAAAAQAASSCVVGRTVITACGIAPAAAETCPARPVRATIDARRLPSRRRVATVHSDAAGRFRVTLPPGTYVLVARTTTSIESAQPVRATVRAGRLARVTVTFHLRHPPPVAADVG
jgi:hypothetical protein